MGIINRWTVAVAAVIMQIGLGSLYAWSVFRQPLSAHYGASITGVNVAFFVAILVFGFATFAAGFLLRHVGPRLVGLAGGILFGGGIFLSAFAGGSLPFLYFTYGVVAAVGGGLGYLVPVAVLPKWFPDRPGLAYGLAVLGFGIGPVVNVPLTSALLSATGGPFQTFGVLGLSYAALIGGAAWFVRNPPEARERPVLHNDGRGQDGKLTQTPYYLRRALGTWQWYALWAVFLLNTSVGLAIYSDAKALAGSIGGATAALASAFVVIVSLSDTAGRLVWPILSEKIGGANVFLAMFLLQAAAFLMLPVLGAESFTAFCVLASAVTSCYGGGYATMSALAAGYYGPQDIGAIYGGILTASSVASFGAPLLLARSADLTGSYDPALYATGGLMLIGAVIPLTLKAPPRAH
ncbi:MAG: OFA family MFS transporter [Actinomycetota bacterium]|nr:OFA family MFS transporter [Actinomycetota bacterium]